MNRGKNKGYFFHLLIPDYTMPNVYLDSIRQRLYALKQCFISKPLRLGSAL